MSTEEKPARKKPGYYVAIIKHSFESKKEIVQFLRENNLEEGDAILRGTEVETVQTVSII